MKKLYIFFVVLSIPHLFAQSIVTTTAGKSGILVGSQQDFAGISYENSSDKFTFNYKSTKQDKLNDNEVDTYPNFKGSNASISFKTDKNKSKLVTEGSWQGGVDVDYTMFFSKDNRSNPEIKETTKIPDGELSQNTIKYKQRTWFGKLSGSLERFYTFETAQKNEDTTFVSLRNPLQTSLTITGGFYKTTRYNVNNDLSWGLSANLSYITNSIRKLKESTIFSLKGVYLNTLDNSSVINIGKQTTFYNGIPENEFYFVPRADIFYRYNFGDKKPVFGVIASYSPLISSIKGIPIRNCFAIGPSFGLPSFSDHVVFAIFNEFVQDINGVFRYELTFNASLPLKFK